MVDAHHHESVHRLDFTFEILCQFSKSQDESYYARLRHITTNFTNQQQVMSFTQTHVVSSKNIPPPQHVINLQQPTSVNFLEDKSVLAEEEEYSGDVLEIEGRTQQTTEAEYVDESAQQTEE